MGDCVECCWVVRARRVEGRGKGWTYDGTLRELSSR
jgi:hypothetical protein